MIRDDMEHIGVVVSSRVKLDVDAEFLEVDTKVDGRNLVIEWNAPENVFHYVISSDDKSNIGGQNIIEEGCIGIGLARTIAMYAACMGAIGHVSHMYYDDVIEAGHKLGDIQEQSI